MNNASPDTADSVLLGIAGLAAVLCVGSFIFLSLPQLRDRYPVKVAAGLSFLQSVFIFALVAVVFSAAFLRLFAIVWCLYYSCVAVVQMFSYYVWSRLNARGKWDVKWTPIDGSEPPKDANIAAANVVQDLIGRGTAWQLASLHAVAFAFIAVLATKRTVEIVSVPLIWEGTRFIKAALIEPLNPRPTTSQPRPDLEKSLKTLHLGWLTRFKFVQERIHKNKMQSLESDPPE